MIRRLIVMLTLLVLVAGSLMAGDLQTANFTIGVTKGAIFNPCYVIRYKLDGQTGYSEMSADRAISVASITQTKSGKLIIPAGSVSFELMDYTYADAEHTVVIKLVPSAASVPETGGTSNSLFKNIRTVFSSESGGDSTVSWTRGSERPNNYITVSYHPTSANAIERNLNPVQLATFSIVWDEGNSSAFSQGTYRSTVTVSYIID